MNSCHTLSEHPATGFSSTDKTVPAIALALSDNRQQGEARAIPVSSSMREPVQRYQFLRAPSSRRKQSPPNALPATPPHARLHQGDSSNLCPTNPIRPDNDRTECASTARSHRTSTAHHHVFHIQ